MKKIAILTCITVAALLSALPQVAQAGGSISSAISLLGTTLQGQPANLGPDLTGQPNQSCGSPTALNTPGNSASSPGSAFNPGGVAPSVYAGQQPQNSRNTASVSQYDVACFETSQVH